MISVDFSENPSIWKLMNPQYHIDEIRAIQRGEFTVTPNTIASHLLSTSIGGVAGYRLTQWAISRGLPIGPLEPWKVLKSAHNYRVASAPFRYASKAGRFVASRLFLPVAFVSLVAYTAMNEPTQHIRDLPHHPWNQPNSMVKYH